jgi:hypothetical protein
MDYVLLLPGELRQELLFCFDPWEIVNCLLPLPSFSYFESNQSFIRLFNNTFITATPDRHILDYNQLKTYFVPLNGLQDMEKTLTVAACNNWELYIRYFTLNYNKNNLLTLLPLDLISLEACHHNSVKFIKSLFASFGLDERAQCNFLVNGLIAALLQGHYNIMDLLNNYSPLSHFQPDSVKNLNYSYLKDIKRYPSVSLLHNSYESCLGPVLGILLCLYVNAPLYSVGAQFFDRLESVENVLTVFIKPKHIEYVISRYGVGVTYSNVTYLLSKGLPEAILTPAQKKLLGLL